VVKRNREGDGRRCGGGWGGRREGTRVFSGFDLGVVEKEEKKEARWGA
jgi:hypothetical protein